MDINIIEQRLASLQHKPSKTKYEKIDRSKIFWKPKVGKQVIRIVPAVDNASNPFKEILVHYNFKFPMLALTNYGEKDPVVEFCSQLRKSSDKEDWKLAGKLSPKLRVFAPVIVRGEEEMGTRLWEFGKEIYTELLNIAGDEDIGDYTSITNGRDITVDTVGKDVTGTDYNKSSVRVKTKTSSITEDAVLLDKILKNQPNILTIYPKKTFEEIKTTLQNYLTPVEESESKDSTEEVEASPVEAQVKKSKASSFEDLFNK